MIPRWALIGFAAFATLLALGHSYGFYAAFANHDTAEIDAVLRNWPFLLVLWFIAIGSWFVRI